MADFISDEEMIALEANSPIDDDFISDEDMLKMEASVPSKAESAITGGFAGASLGFMDELTGGIESLANMVGVRNTHDLSELELGTPSFNVGENYVRGRDAKREMQEAAKQANPNLYTTGQVAGAIGSGIATGGGSSLGAMTATGALQGLGESKADLTEGDLGGALRDTSIGGALGLGAGAIGKGISYGVGKAAPKIKSGLNSIGDSLKSNAENLAVRSTGATGNQASKFAPEAGRELLDEGLIKFGDNAANIAERVGKKHALAGDAISEALETLEKRGVKGSVDNVVGVIESQIDELSAVPGNEKIIGQLQREVDNLYNRGESLLGIKAAEQAKRNFQGQTNYFSDEAEKKATGRIAKSFRNEVERAATEADPNVAQKFIDEKKTYGLLSPIKEAAEKRAMQQSQSPFGGLSDVIVGATAGPAGLAKKFAIEQVGRRASSSGAVMADMIGDIVKNQPQRLGKFAKPLQDAMLRGGNSLAATHYVLSSTNPEYRQLVNTSEDDRDESED